MPKSRLFPLHIAFGIITLGIAIGLFTECINSNYPSGYFANSKATAIQGEAELKIVGARAPQEALLVSANQNKILVPCSTIQDLCTKAKSEKKYLILIEFFKWDSTWSWPNSYRTADGTITASNKQREIIYLKEQAAARATTSHLMIFEAIALLGWFIIYFLQNREDYHG